MKNIGRNELCHCSSGKKYKKCCLNKQIDTLEDDNFVEDMQRVIFGMREMFLSKKAHIKKYKKLRELHAEVVDSMMTYFESGKYKWEYTDQEVIKASTGQSFFNIKFNPNDRLGRQALPNMLIYNHGLDIPSICEVFLEKRKFRKKEKIQLMKDMLNSVESLFEIRAIDKMNGYVTLRDIFTNQEYKITDISMSLSEHYNKFYLYTRLITSGGITFGTGFAMSFMKDDKRIKNWINEHKKDYCKKTELIRFFTIYTLYLSITEDKVEVVVNEV